jgi:hypothetical protein
MLYIIFMIKKDELALYFPLGDIVETKKTPLEGGANRLEMLKETKSTGIIAQRGRPVNVKEGFPNGTE